MTDRADPADRDRWARLRFAIIGPLLADPPAKGQLQSILRELSSREWRHPITGMPLRFGTSTLERWYRLARRDKQDPFAALRTQIRSDAGAYRMLSSTLREHIDAQYRQYPTWSVQLHYDNLRVTFGNQQPFPSYNTVRNYFRARGLRKLPRSAGIAAINRQFGPREIRSFEAEAVNGLWHLDFHQCSIGVATRQGIRVKPVALCIMDDRSRIVCHIQWAWSETTKDLVHGFAQALMRRGLPRSLLTDNGQAILAGEFQKGLETLSINHFTTLPRSPFQNGKQEAMWGRIEGRLIAMLQGTPDLDLALLNRASHAWIEFEYHRTRHTELGCTPLERYRAGPDVGRQCPSADALRRAFRIEVTRTQRGSDGTVSLQGRRFEVPSQFAHLEHLQLRYARWDLSAVDLVDRRSGVVLSPLYPLDKTANAAGERRRKADPLAATTPPPPREMAPLLKKLLADFAATGLPPPYLPEDSEEPQS
jgi:putative transposase